MEKEQIIKALECCTVGIGTECEKCPYMRTAYCNDVLKKEVLALIKSQDEQIFQLENRLKECENGYAGTLHLESCKLHDAEEKIKELTEENERLQAEITHLECHRETDIKAVKNLTQENERLKTATEEAVRSFTRLETLYKIECKRADTIKANTVREIFKEIYSSLDYIEEQMEPEEIPECFFSVREDINALKEKFESEGAEK
ncbi:MAG: hypothetical protein IKB51_04030 [Clostridia bacterium]|nr:hypothetical protein [Clostridia bacterium]